MRETHLITDHTKGSQWENVLLCTSIDLITPMRVPLFGMNLANVLQSDNNKLDVSAGWSPFGEYYIGKYIAIIYIGP